MALHYATDWAPVPRDRAAADEIVQRETAAFRDRLAQHEREAGELVPYFDCRVEYSVDGTQAQLVFDYPSQDRAGAVG